MSETKKCLMRECKYYEKESILCAECARNYCPECPARNSCDENLECIYEDHFQYDDGLTERVKKTYRVEISQQYVHSAIIEVDAYSEPEAEIQGLKLIRDTALTSVELVEDTESSFVLGGVK